jgi:hypothetical protein
MKLLLLAVLGVLGSYAAADDVIIGPADGPASSYPFCGS